MDEAIAGGHSPISIQSVRKDLAGICRADYRAILRDAFTAKDLSKLLRYAAPFWPEINRHQYHAAPTLLLLEVARERLLKTMNVRLNWQRGPLDLWGFYARASKRIKKPIIWVNSGLTPVEVMASLGHEIGHHVVMLAFGSDNPKTARVDFGTRFSEHLDDYGELAPDALAIVAGMPRKAAERVFQKVDLNQLTESKLPAALKILREFAEGSLYDSHGTGLDPPDHPRTLNFFAALLHYVRVRQALLEVFDI